MSLTQQVVVEASYFIRRSRGSNPKTPLIYFKMCNSTYLVTFFEKKKLLNLEGLHLVRIA
jgi:hypothetical protein